MSPAEEQAFLREHTYCCLATGRSDGSPQQCLVRYYYDGADIVISTLSTRPQWLNSKRQPRVSLLVRDGRRYVLVYGRAERLGTDADGLEAFKRTSTHAEYVKRGLSSDEALAEALDADKRVMLRIVPSRLISHE
ncbi:MAG: pyridoxamine 5'-phosphate oxidase family protein [Chloroflexi bacterium]|nr:pyridoxamine 5'-phosphate oxidase family protein [Chloroflexota bacterium]